MKKVLFNWSGGKDSSMCLYRLLSSGEFEVKSLITTINRDKGRISMHGVREELLEIQAERLRLPLYKLMLPDQATMEEYDRLMGEAMDTFRKKKIEFTVYGDIFLEDLRSYREQKATEAGMQALFPLWNQSTEKLAKNFIESGFKAIVVCVDESKLNRTYVGREYDSKFLEDLPPEVDPCGENGEFHTFVYKGPIFNKQVFFKKGEIVQQTYKVENSSGQSSSKFFWFCDLLNKDEPT